MRAEPRCATSGCALHNHNQQLLTACRHVVLVVVVVVVVVVGAAVAAVVVVTAAVGGQGCLAGGLHRALLTILRCRPTRRLRAL